MDLIDFQLQILTHRQIYCTYIIILLWSVTGHILLYNEVDAKVEDRFLKHELQMQLMAENMEGIMQMIAHKLDTLEKKGLHGDKKEEVNQKWKLPTFDDTSKWGAYAKQAGVIF